MPAAVVVVVAVMAIVIIAVWLGGDGNLHLTNPHFAVSLPLGEFDGNAAVGLERVLLLAEGRRRGRGSRGSGMATCLGRHSCGATSAVGFEGAVAAAVVFVSIAAVVTSVARDNVVAEADRVAHGERRTRRGSHGENCAVSMARTRETRKGRCAIRREN